MFEKSIHFAHQLTDWAEKILTWVLPFTCVLCKEPAEGPLDLCQACRQDLPIVAHKCPQCGTKLGTTPPLTCGACLQAPPPFAATYALYDYQWPLPSLILGLKFGQELKFARVLGELLAEKIAQDWYKGKSLPELIVPVPLHRERLKERGFNQALELARPISKRLKIPIDTHSVHRVKNTRAQMELKAKERRLNIKGAFAVDGHFTHKRIAILDDVVTTASTAKELTRALLSNGAAEVDLWCCARAQIRKLSY